MTKYKGIKVAVDNCIFTLINQELHILLIQMKKKPFTNQWALPGGLVGEGEALDKAAARILNEETNVRHVYLEQLYTFGKISRDPFGRVISVAYMALVHQEKQRLKTASRYAAVKWWKVSEVPDLAYDHTQILAYAKKRLAWKMEYTNLAWSLLPPQFTLTELQKLYESVLARKLDKRNFRKKFLALKLIKKVNRKAVSGAHRPAELYAFTNKQPILVDTV